MLNFLRSSKRIARDIKKIVEDVQAAKKEVKARRIKEAIKKLEDISSKESDLYKKIKKYPKGLTLQVVEDEIRKTLVIATKTIGLLKQNNLGEVLYWLEVIITSEANVQKLVQERIEILKYDEGLAKKIRPILDKYIKRGMTVIELFNSNRSDILRALSDLVGDSGKVFGIDELNPFSHNKEMEQVSALPNVELVKAKFPPIPAPQADVIVVREFLWAYHKVDKNRAFQAISSKIKKKGLLILLLNHTEYHNEKVHHEYSNSVALFPDKFRLIKFNKFELVFQKE